MKYEYVDRFWDEYSNNGFKKLVNDGVFCRNTHYNFIPTYTGPGHASIFTGTTPSVHGIIGNNWYNRADFSPVYCAGDWKSRTICLCKNLMKSLILVTGKCPLIYYFVIPLEIN